MVERRGRGGKILRFDGAHLSFSLSLAQFWGLRIFVACLQSDLSDQFPLCLSPLSVFPLPSLSPCFSGSFVLFCSFAWHLFNPQRDAASSLKSEVPACLRCKRCRALHGAFYCYIDTSSSCSCCCCCLLLLCASFALATQTGKEEGAETFPVLPNALAMETTKKGSLQPRVCLTLWRGQRGSASASSSIRRAIKIAH